MNDTQDDRVLISTPEMDEIERLNKNVQIITKTINRLMDIHIQTLREANNLAVRLTRVENHNRELIADFLGLNRDIQDLAAETSPSDDAEISLPDDDEPEFLCKPEDLLGLPIGYSHYAADLED